MTDAVGQYDTSSTPPSAARPLALDPARAIRGDRRPYGVIDIGSNSVRLVVYDELGRAPLPRFNEKSLCRLGDGLAQTGRDRRRGLPPHGRGACAGSAPSPTRWASGRIDVTATEAIRRATQRPRPRGRDRVANRAFEVRILSGAEEATLRALGVISGFFRPMGLVGDMGGGSLEVAEALDDRVGERWVSLPLGCPAGRGAAGQGGAGEAKRRIDALLEEGLPPALTEPVFYRRRRRLAGAGQGAHGGGRGAGPGRARLHAGRRRGCAPSPRSSGTCRRPSSRPCPACRRAARAPCRRRPWCSTGC